MPWERGCAMQYNTVTSNRSAQCFCSRILSPLANVSSLLSSMTEFIFSTHNASTSPSKTIYLRSFFSVGLLMSRNMQDNRPSVQSRVTGSRVPYSSITEQALAFSVYSFVGIPNLEKIKNLKCRSAKNSSSLRVPHRKLFPN